MGLAGENDVDGARYMTELFENSGNLNKNMLSVYLSGKPDVNSYMTYGNYQESGRSKEN